MNRRHIFIFTIFWLSNLTVFGADTFDLAKQNLLIKLSQFYQYSDDTDEKVIAIIEEGQYDDFLGEALTESFYYRSFKVVEAFIERAKGKKIDIINGIDKNGWTPLHHAAYARNVDVVNYLLEHKVNAQLKSNDGWLPLNLALYLDICAHPFGAHSDSDQDLMILEKRLNDLKKIVVILIKDGGNDPSLLVNQSTAYEAAESTKIYDQKYLETIRGRPFLESLLTTLSKPHNEILKAMKDANVERLKKEAGSLRRS